MTVILCVDERMGMSFGGRRVSRDDAVTDRISRRFGGQDIFTEEKGAFLPWNGQKVIPCGEPALCAGEGGICFVETADPAIYAAQTDTYVIYKWNRKYPSDVKFTLSLADNGFVLAEKNDFAGRSHENITEEIWTKNKKS